MIARRMRGDLAEERTMDRDRFQRIRAAAHQTIAARKYIDPKWCYDLGQTKVLKFSSVGSFMHYLHGADWRERVG